MVRELAISIYLFVFRVLFQLFTFCPQKKKATFVASFGDNIFFTMKELEKQTDEQIVILKTPQCKVDFKHQPNRHVLTFALHHPIQWIRSIYHLATSKKIFVDNYYGFLAVTTFKPNVSCVQLWHAAGAIKQFALKDPSVQHRSRRAFHRFQVVYNRFNHVVVGSNKMAAIFEQSFGIGGDRMLRTGIPRTDFFFDERAKKGAIHRLQTKYPVVLTKKVILYAPTYRDQELHVSHIQLDIDRMYEHLKEDYVLFLRLHPAVHVNLANDYPNFVYDLSNYDDVNHLLLITDILITDYSSIPFEFSLLQKPMIFFPYDLEEYAKSRGFWEDYEALVPGPIVQNSEELINIIQTGDFNMDRVKQFAQEWNEFSNGRSSEQLIRFLYKC